MIEVDRLTKFYGNHAAIRDVSFSAEPGQILGVLGPNGAGKTTTMRILTGYMPASSGTARVAGFDVFEQSLDVRRRVGYLPETPPLYAEMTPTSYLDFVARIKGVSRGDRPGAIERALHATATDDVAHQPLGTLSRGYKQRVAIAQAIVHDPEVIVLDEPTIGLDPKQVIGIRKLIKGLSSDRTVILSTHILPEVTQLCDKVVIISRGEIVAEDTTDSLTATEDLEQVFLRVTTSDVVADEEAVAESTHAEPDDATADAGEEE
ncbi:MAG: ATP-binding cassette domain-containing protein [Acidobacteria bacterium]|nr:ATP-binding cassette domain-containing protein [Acidobacteriota bacterium]